MVDLILVSRLLGSDATPDGARIGTCKEDGQCSSECRVVVRRCEEMCHCFWCSVHTRAIIGSAGRGLFTPPRRRNQTTPRLGTELRSHLQIVQLRKKKLQKEQALAQAMCVVFVFTLSLLGNNVLPRAVEMSRQLCEAERVWGMELCDYSRHDDTFD